MFPQIIFFRTVGIYRILFLSQVGHQDLAFGLKFDAKGIIDCYEKDLQLLPSGRRRNIEFRMVEGDFQTFEGEWSILEVRSFFFNSSPYMDIYCELFQKIS